MSFTGVNGFVFDHMDERLDDLFGIEYANLPTVLRVILITDFCEANDADRRDYRQNIGVGNLESYAKVLAAQASR